MDSLGTFVVRIGVNPRTSAKMTVPAETVPSLRAAKPYRETVKQET